MQNGFHPGECNTDQAKHLHYTKRKSIYMRPREGGSWARRDEGRRETAPKGEDNEEDKWRGKVRRESERSRWWSAGGGEENGRMQDAERGMTRRREVLSHGQQLADWWWWERQWGRTATSQEGEWASGEGDARRIEEVGEAGVCESARIHLIISAIKKWWHPSLALISKARWMEAKQTNEVKWKRGNINSRLHSFLVFLYLPVCFPPPHLPIIPSFFQHISRALVPPFPHRP